MNAKRIVPSFLLLLTMLAGICSVPTGDAGDKKTAWRKFLPAGAYKQLVQREVKIVADNLTNSDFEKINRTKVAALMIAGYTLTAQKGAPKELDGVRSSALRLAEIIGDKDKISEAKGIIDSIGRLKGDSSAKNLGLNFKKYVLNDYYLMVPYMTKKKGGDGLHAGLQFSRRLQGTQEYIENLFSYLSKRPLKSKYLDKAYKEIELAGYRTAVSGELIEAYLPKRKSKKRDPVVWGKTSKTMIEYAIALAHAANRKDAIGIQKAAAGVLDSCVKCHKVFQ